MTMPCLHVCKLVIKQRNNAECSSPTEGNRECDFRDATVNHDMAIKVVVVGMAVLVEVSTTDPSGIVETEDVTLLRVTVIGTLSAGLTWLIQNHRHT